MSPPSRRLSGLHVAGAVLAIAVGITLCALAFGLCGCAGLFPAPAVTIAGEVTNRATPALVVIETVQGDAAIARGEDPEKTVAPKWAPFWTAWKVWVAAQRAWADAYEHGGTGLAQAEASAQAAFCKASAVLPPEVPKAVIGVATIACAELPALLPSGPAPSLVDAGVADAATDGGAR